LFFAFNRIRAEIRADIAGTYGHHVYPRALEFDARTLADRVHGKLRCAVNGMKRQRDMPSNARYIDNRARPLLLHHRNHRLHGFDSAEEISLEGLAARGHLHVSDRVQDSVARVVDPHVDALEMMEGEPHNPINLLAIAYVASES